jgi:hypothetical protein
MSVAKTSEITASSSKSFEEAVRKGIRKMYRRRLGERTKGGR